MSIQTNTLSISFLGTCILNLLLCKIKLTKCLGSHLQSCLCFPGKFEGGSNNNSKMFQTNTAQIPKIKIESLKFQLNILILSKMLCIIELNKNMTYIICECGHSKEDSKYNILHSSSYKI